MIENNNFGLNQIILFIKSSLEEINPYHNIKKIHTNIRGDILSGITVAIIALPLALAFGEISQLGPEAGIWSAIVGGVVGGLFGGCLVGVSGPTAPMASQVAVFMGAFVIGNTNNPDLVAAFSIIFLSGLILVIMSMFKISRFIHYVPYSVIAGFMCGIGIIVILSQVNAFLGLESNNGIYNIFKDNTQIFRNINIEALYVSIPSLLIILLWSFFEKKIRFLSNIPSPLVALIAGTSIAYFLNLDISYIGDKMSNTKDSDIFSIYLPDLSRFNEFLKPAFILAGLAILDSLLSCKVADNMTGIRHSSDRETFGQGLANMVSGILGGIPTATATTQTVGNITFGAKTPLSTIIKGLTLFAILSGLGFLVAVIPNACLAAILFKLGIDILDYRIMPVLKKLPKTDMLVFIIVFFVTVYEDLMIAIIIGTIFAFIISFREIKITFRSNYKNKIIPFSQSDFIIKGKDNKLMMDLPICVIQPQGPLFFYSIQSLIKTYDLAPKHKVLIVDMGHITTIDLSGVYALEDFINVAESKNIKVFVSNAKSHVKQILESLNFIKNIGSSRYKETKESLLLIILKHFQLNIKNISNQKLI